MHNTRWMGLGIAMFVALAVSASLWGQGPAAAPAPEPAAPPVVDPARATPASAPATEPAAPGTVRFEFEGVSYATVIRRFAAMVNKPILGDFDVPGKLTFFDAQPYSYPEAFDTLNLILAMKGHQIVENGRYLRVVKLADLGGLRPRILLGQDAAAEKVRPGEIVTMLVPIKYLDAAEAAKAVARLVSNFGSIAPVSKGRGLLITDQLSAIQNIRSLLGVLDVATLSPRSLRSIPLANASAESVAETVNTLFGAQRRLVIRQGSGEGPVERPGPEDDSTVRATFDGRTNTVLLLGTGQSLEMAEQTVRQLDVRTPQEVGQIRIFQLKSASAVQVAAALDKLVPPMGAGRGRQTAQARIVPDAAANRVIVSASQELSDRIAETIAKLDAGAVAPAGTAILPVKNVEAASLVGAVSTAMAVRDDRGRMRPAAAVVAEPNSNSIIVTGEPAQIDRVRQMLAELDRPAAAEAREVHVVKLAAGDPRATANALNNLFRTRQQQGRASRAELRVEADPASNSLIVSASTADWPKVSALLDELKAQVSPEAAWATAVVQLKHADARELAGNLLRVFQGRRRPGGVGPSIAADRKSNTLILSAAGDDMKELRALVASVDVPAAQAAQPITIVRLQAADAAALARKLSGMLPASWRDGETGVAIEFDTATNSVLLRASPEQREKIEPIIAQLDAATKADARETRVVPLKYASGAAVANVLTQMYPPSRGRRGEGEPRVTVSPAPSEKAVVIDAPMGAVRQMAAMIVSLDVPAGAEAVQVRVYAIESGSARETAASLGRLFAEQRRGQGPAAGAGPRFEADGTDKQLLVAGSAEQLAQIEPLLKRLQVPENPMVVRVFALKQARAAELAGVLQAMLSEEGGRRRREAAAQAAAMPEANAVVVRAPRDRMAVAQEIVAAFDVKDAGGRTVIQTVKLAQGRADTIARAVDEALARRGGKTAVAVTADPASNVVLVRGPAAEVPDVLAIIKQLDAQGQESPVAVRVFPLKNGKAGDLGRSLERMFREMLAQRARAERKEPVPFAIAADDRTSSLVVSTSPSHFAMIEGILAQLDVQERAPRDVQYIWLKRADAQDVVRQIDAMYVDRRKEDRPLATADTFSNSLVVVAKEGDLKAIEQAVAKVDDVEDTTVQIRVVPLTQVKADKMAEVIRRVYGQISDSDVHVTTTLPADGGRLAPRNVGPKDKPVKGQPAAGPAPRPAVTIAVDKDANALIISAMPRELEQIQKLIDELTAGAAGGDTEYRIFKLKQANPAMVARMLEQLFNPKAPTAGAPAAPGRGGVRAAPSGAPVILPPPTITVAADVRSQSVIVRAKPLDFDLIKPLIEQLDTVPSVISEVRVFPLTNTDSTEVARNLTDIFQLARQNSPLGDLFGTGGGGGGGAFARIQRAEMMRQILQMRVGPEGAPGTTAEAAAPQISVSANRTTNSVIVSAPKESMAIVEKIVSELDQKAAESTAPLVRMYPLAHAQVATTVQALREVFAARTGAAAAGGARGGRGGGGQADRGAGRLSDVTITGEESSRLVIVRAPADQQELVANLIKEIDGKGKQDVAPVKVYTLVSADARAVAQALSQTLADSRGGRGAAGGQEVRVSADPSSNSVVVRAPAGEHEKIAAIIAKMDVAPAKATLPVRMIQLQHAEPQALARMLSMAFTGQPGGRGRGAADSPVVIEAAAGMRVLLVRADEATFARIQALAAEVDKDETAASQIYVIPLARGNAADVARQIMELYNQQGRTARAGGGVQEPLGVTADERANALIIAASPRMYEQVNSWVPKVEALKPAKTEMRLIRLQYASPEDVDKAIQEIYGPTPAPTNVRPGAGRAGAGGPRAGAGVSGGGRVQTSVLSGQGGILIGAGDEDYKAIVELVKQLEAAAQDARRVVKVVPLVHANNTRVAAALQQMYRQAGRAARPEDAVTISAVMQTPAVVISAPRSVLADIEAVIAQLDRKELSPKLDFRTFTLANTSPSKIMPALREMMLQLERTMPGESITVQADERTRSVIVTARASAFEQIEGVIKTLDRAPADGAADVIIVPLRNADAARLAVVLTTMLKPDAAGLVTPEALALQEQVRRLRVRGTLAENLPDLDLTKPIKITADPPRPQGSNSLVIASTPDNLRAMRAIVESLDILPLAENATVRLLVLKHADAQTVMTTLRDVFAQGVRLGGKTGSVAFGRAEPENAAGKALVSPLNVSADSRTNAIILTGRSEAVALAETLVCNLDVKAADPAVQLAIIPLKFNDAGVVAQMVMQLFTARKAAVTPPGQPPLARENVDVVADSLTNSMIVSAGRDNMAMVRDLVAKLDVEAPDKTGVVRMIALKNADASRVGSMLQGLVRQGFYKPGALTGAAAAALAAREKISIAVDVRTNVLIISASKENLAVLEEILRTIDSSSDYALQGDVRLFPLRNAEATRLAPSLEKLFRDKLAAEQAAGGTGRSLAVSIVPEPRTNSLLVTAGREAFATIEQMIRQLDGAPVATANQYRVFKLKYATAATLAGTLDRLFRQRNIRETQRDVVTVVADPVANSLVVGATGDDMKSAADLIARLDTARQQADWTTEVFPLTDADATALAETIRGLEQARGTGAAGGAGGLSVSADARTNALIVTGGPADVQRISELVARLDSKNLTKVTQIRVYPLAHADADELARLLTDALTRKPVQLGPGSPARQTLLQFIRETPDGRKLTETALQEGIVISADKRANSLLVLAPAPLVPLLRNLITALDEASPQAAQIRVFALQNADARQMADVLMQLFRLQRTAASGAAGDRAVRYTLVAPAAQPAADPQAPKAPDARNAPAPPPAAESTAVVGSAEQYSLSVTVDVRTNSLLIGGTPQYIALASQVIQSLDSIPAQERVTQIYRLRNAQAKDIQAALQAFLDRERQKLTQSLGADAMGAAQRMLEREVAVVAEAASNTLLLSASPKYFQTVANMIDELDQPPPQVLVQCLLAEVTLDDTTDLGFEWMLAAKDGPKTFKLGTDLGVAASWAKSGGLNLSVTGGDLTFFLRALQAQGRLEVLSRPQILAVDNQQSQINIGERVPFVNSSRITDTGSVVNTIQYEQVGVILKVTPRVNPDGLVKMDVHPEISEVSDSTVQISEGLNAVRIISRTADTTVSVQDGHTVVIGGLITNRDSATDRKVPVLGDVPWLGALFKATSRTKRRTELLIILTPHVLRNARQADWAAQGGIRNLEAVREKAATERQPVKEFFLGRPKSNPLTVEPNFVPLEKALDAGGPGDPKPEAPATRPRSIDPGAHNPSPAKPAGPPPPIVTEEDEYR